MRTAMQQLSLSQREAIAAEGRESFEAEIKRYAQMSAAEKKRYLDDRIDQMEKMRQQFGQQNGGPRPPGGTGTFGTNGPGRGRAAAREREKRRKERLNQTTPESGAVMDNFRKDMANRRQQHRLRT